MRIAGFLLLTAGWVIVIAAILLLHFPVSTAGFLLAGIAIQILGLVFAIHSHRVMKSEGG